MVKKILSVLTVILFLNSCGFFGDTMFPTAVSENYGWLFSGNTRDFYILDNGENDDLLIHVSEDNGNIRVAIFDTALNLRGYMEDGTDGISTDGIGFVDHDDDFVIGQAKISRLGTADPAEVSFVPVPDMGNNAAIIPYTDAGTSTDYYIRVDQSGMVYRYDDIWTDPTPFQQQINSYSDHLVIRQNDRFFTDIVFANQSGEIFVYTKDELYDHVTVPTIITLDTPTFTITNTSLSQWVTRCSRGYFVSTFNGEYILYGTEGSVIDRVENKHNSSEVATIDYNCEYYYVINKDKGRIEKERLPF
jgi:hypothetical protein